MIAWQFCLDFEEQSNSVFEFWRTIWKIIFHSGCAILHYYQQYTNIRFLHDFCQWFLIFIIVIYMDVNSQVDLWWMILSIFSSTCLQPVNVFWRKVYSEPFSILNSGFLLLLGSDCSFYVLGTNSLSVYNFQVRQYFKMCGRWN